jgi:AcrR family transcriptional regulator
MVMVESTAATRSRQLTAADWIRAATDAIVEGGVAAVAVEPLAARLGTTKGSFYHHFDNRDALVTAALDEWERSQTEAVIRGLQLIPDPAERLRAVVAAAIADSAGGVRDAALLASATHPLIKPFVERVTARRLRYLTDAYVQLGLSEARAGRRALLLYSAYLGLFDYLRVGFGAGLDDAELRAYAEELLTTLIPAG